MDTYFIKPGYEHRTGNATLEEEQGDYWNPTRLKFSRHAQFAIYKEAARLIQRENLTSVIDVGAGLGHKLVELILPLPQVQRLVAVDQPSCCAVASRMHPQVNFVSADFEKPGESGIAPADLVMSVDVIEHMDNPDMLLDFIKAHCHAGSWVILSTPERDIRRGVDNMKSPKPEHVREWNRAEFAAYLTDRGFEVVDHPILPAFRVDFSRFMLRERWRMFRKGMKMNYAQMAVCRLRER